jgi:hypothetical protein
MHLVTSKGKRLSSSKINQLASETLRAALGEEYEPEAVKAARRRLLRKPTESGQKQ